MSSEYLRSESSNITISILKYNELARVKSEAVVNIAKFHTGFRERVDVRTQRTDDFVRTKIS